MGVVIAVSEEERRPGLRRSLVDLQEKVGTQTRRGRWLASLCFVLVAIGMSGLFGVAVDRPDTVIALALVLLCAVAIMRWPITGIYATVVASIVLDMFP